MTQEKPAKTDTKKGHKSQIVVMVIALVVFWVCTALAYNKTASSFEKAVFDSVYNLPKSLTGPAIAITMLGSIWMVGIACVVAVLLKKYRLAVRIALVGFVTYCFVWLTKVAVGRPRPNVLLHVAQRGPKEESYGFVSGHSAVVAAVGLTLLFIYKPKWRWVIWLIMVLVPLSRLFLGVHLPLDVIGGLALGTFMAVAIHVIDVAEKPKSLKRFKKRKQDEQPAVIK